MLFIVLAIGVFLIVFATTKFKLHPFLSLLLGTYLWVLLLECLWIKYLRILTAVLAD